ncbi:MAG: choice-of-anchor I family protein [Pseudomonadota bacterium]|nr:choice-of-anchor I family protein [Pseudomonadota bacterium]
MFTLQILHASDLEGGIDAIENAPNFAAVVEALEADAAANSMASILLSAGDNFIPGPFFNAGGDVATTPALEGFYNALFGLIDEAALPGSADANGDGFFDNDEIDAALAADAGLSAADVYVTDVNGDGFPDFFDEIDNHEGRIDVAIMNALGFDASALGNHEFDAGADFLENIVNYDSEEGNGLSSTGFAQLLAAFPGHVNFLQEVDTPGVQFPYLSANLDFSADGDLGGLFTDAILPNTDFASDLASARDDLADPTFAGADSRDDKIAPATVIARDGERIGVVGATTQLIETISSVGDVTETTAPGINDMPALAAAIQTQVDAMVEAGINKIVLVSHLQQIALETELAGLLRGVDVIVAGGSDTLLADETDALRAGDEAADGYPREATSATGEPVLIVSTDGEYSYVGRLVVSFDDAGVVMTDALDAAVSGAYATDAAGVERVGGDLTSGAAQDVAALTEVVTGIVTARDGDILGEAEVFLNGDRASVRTEETNLGNLTADANLAAARAIDDTIVISIKNGGGIRASIGDAGDGTGAPGATAANPVSGKEAGQISQLDAENALRFNNSLATVQLTPAELKIVLEHAVAAVAEGATPGQFPQVGGLAFSYDPTRTAQVLGEDGLPVTKGERIVNVALIDEAGEPTVWLIRDGEVVDGAPASLGVVTLGFLATGGDGYPFAAFSEAVELGVAEQDAFRDYLSAEFPEGGDADFAVEDTPIYADGRIINLAEQPDPLAGAPELTETFFLSRRWQYQHESDPENEDSPEAASEVVSHDDGTLVVTNGNLGRIDVLRASNGTLKGAIDLTALPGFDGVQSVAIRNGLIAAAISRAPEAIEVFGEEVAASRPGYVAIFDAETLALISTADVGNLPDMVTFTADGATILVAGEGEFNEDTGSDDNPLGTVAVIDVTDPAAPAARVLDFTAFDGAEDAARAAGVRVAPGLDLSQDLEPEYISVAPDGTTAYVSLQENNALGVIDLERGLIVDVIPLGTKDHSAPGAGLDANDNGVAEIRLVENLVGMYMPDAIATFEVDGATYIATANEGDGRGWDEERVGDLAEEGLIDAAVDIEGLERLTVSTTDGDVDGDGDIDVLHSFGARSFTIFDEAGNVVFDSGSMMEEYLAANFPERFNDDDGEDGENRSDAKGPEPEAIEVGHAYGRTFIFVGLERDSGIFVFDATDLSDVTMVDYMPGFGNGDRSPEVIEFIAAEDSASGFAQIAASYEISGTTSVFDILPAEPTIMQIQGRGHVSAYAGRTVTTSGVVTALDDNGFYLQDALGDGDDATSDAIFVYTGDAPTVAVGDGIGITARVSEYIPGGASSGNLSTTQLSGAEIEVTSTGNDLPAAVILGANGRAIPTGQVISEADQGVNHQENAGDFDPENDGLDFYESVEGMRVTVEGGAVISPTNAYDETWIVADGGAGTSPGLTDRGTLLINADADGYGDLNPERIQLQYDDGLLPEGFEAPTLQAGDVLGDVTGVMGYDYGNFQIGVTEAFEVETASTNAAEVSRLHGSSSKLTVATYNVLNLTAAEADGDAAQMAAIAAQIAGALGGPDIVALQEVQDDSGVADDGVTSAEATLQALADAIEAAGGPAYSVVSAEVADGADGGVPGGNIRNAYLYNAERVSLTEAITLDDAALAGFGVDAAGAFEDSRKPLLGRFEFGGEEITLINNHFSSRSGSDPIFGGPQPFEQGGEDARAAQAAAVNAVVDAILAADPGARVAVAGDLNTFEFVDEIVEDLQGVGAEQVLTDLASLSSDDDRYSYIFDGNAQVLDHILASDSLMAGARVDYVHVNTDFAEAASDHDPVLAQFSFNPGDRIGGGRAGEEIAGTAADDLILGRRGADVVTGGAGDDDLRGNYGRDALRGGAGEDWLEGGYGRDQLWGGEGADRFVLAQGRGVDRIQDFDAAEDMIVIAGFGPDAGFGDITITDRPFLGRAVIEMDGERLASVVIDDASTLTEDSFAFL